MSLHRAVLQFSERADLDACIKALYAQLDNFPLDTLISQTIKKQNTLIITYKSDNELCYVISAFATGFKTASNQFRAKTNKK